jgi:ribosomal protein S27E
MARQSGDAQAGGIACLLCGSTQLRVEGSQVREERPRSAFVLVSCAQCNHYTMIHVVTVNSQVAIDFNLGCPMRCDQQDAHSKI